MKETFVIVWRVYEPCNLGCEFCGYSREIVRNRAIADSEIVTNFGKILSDFQKKYKKEAIVSWIGGEPLLWKALPNISTLYHDEFQIKLGITTNGTLLERESVRKMLISKYDLLTISVDGFENIHDKYRKEVGLFLKIKKQLAILINEISASQSQLKIRINTILMRENIYEFESFCNEVASWGVKELTFNQLGGIDRPEFYTDNRLLPEQVNWLNKEFFQIQQRLQEKGLKVFGTKEYIHRIMATSNHVALPIENCHPGQRFLFINEQNLVSPCNFTTSEYGIPLSEIRSAEDLFEISKIFREKQISNRAMPCNDCHSTQVFEKFNNKKLETIF